MTVLHVDDEFADDLRGAYRQRFAINLSLDGKDVRWLANVVVFAKAYEAVRWLRSGCWVNGEGEPEFEYQPGSRQWRPDLTILDIDFKLGMGTGAEASTWKLSRNDETSARLGWAVASVARDVLGSNQDIVMYTGKGDVEAGLQEACEQVECDGIPILPYVRVEPKTKGFELVFSLASRKFDERAERFISSGQFSTKALELFLEYFMVLRTRSQYEAVREQVDGGQENQRLPGMQFQIWLYENFKEVLSLFPDAFHKISRVVSALDVRKDIQVAVDEVIAALGAADRNCSLQRALKQVHISGGSVFLTPSAAVRHNHPWDYANPGPTAQSSETLLKLDVKGRPENLAELAEQEESFEAWFSVTHDVDPALREAIVESGVEPFMWFRSLGDANNLALDDWESTFEFWLSKLTAQSWGRLKVSLGELPSGKFLTNWKGLFGGVDSAFGEILMWCESEKAETATFSGRRTESGAELTLEVQRFDKKHIGSKSGLKGATRYGGLRGWGRSWIELSRPPLSDTQKEVTVDRHGIWPLLKDSEDIGVTSASCPVIKLHWHIKDYLQFRDLS